MKLHEAMPYFLSGDYILICTEGLNLRYTYNKDIKEVHIDDEENKSESTQSVGLINFTLSSFLLDNWKLQDCNNSDLVWDKPPCGDKEFDSITQALTYLFDQTFDPSINEEGLSISYSGLIDIEDSNALQYIVNNI